MIIGILRDIESAKKFLDEILIFGSFSGLIINIDKSEAIWIGSEYLNENKSSPLGV